MTAGAGSAALLWSAAMHEPVPPSSLAPSGAAPETTLTAARRVSCDGSGGIRARSGVAPSALGHPRIWMEIDEKGVIDCPYCERRFVLTGDAAHQVAPMGDEGYEGGRAGH